MNLRYAKSEDIDSIVQCTVDHIDSFPMCDGEYIATVYLEVMLKHCVSSEDHILVIDSDDAGVNTILFAQCGPGWYNPTIIANELLLWTRPDVRSYKRFRSMINKLEEWARQKNAKRIMLAATSGIRPDDVAKLYTRCGYTYSGPQHLKEL